MTTKWIITTLLITASLYFPFPLFGVEETETDLGFNSAVTSYENGDYPTAISKLDRLFEELKLTSIDKIIKAHSVLGASLYFQGNETDARKHFKTILNFNPDYNLPEDYYPPKVVGLFNEVKGIKKLEETVSKTQKAQDKEATEIRAKGLFEKEDKKKDENTRNHYLNNFIPFGFGQFKNNEPTKGYFFLTSEAITLISFITNIGIFKGLQNSDGTFDNLSVGSGLKTGVYTSLAFYLAFTATGITDAILNYKEFPYAKTGKKALSLSILPLNGSCALLLTFNRF